VSARLVMTSSGAGEDCGLTSTTTSLVVTSSSSSMTRQASCQHHAPAPSPFNSPVPELVQALNEKLAAAGTDLNVPGVRSETLPPPQRPHHANSCSSGTQFAAAKHAVSLDLAPPKSVSSLCQLAQQQRPTTTLANRTTSCLLNQVLTDSGFVLPNAALPACPPAHGVRAVCGKRTKMEDTFSVQCNFVDVAMAPHDVASGDKLPARILSQVGAARVVGWLAGCLLS
jgi:hypothetical protein